MPEKIQFDSPWNVANMDALFDDVAAAKGSEDTLTEKIAAMDAATSTAADAAAAAQDTAAAAIDSGVKNEFKTTIEDITGGFSLTVNADGSFTTSGSKSTAQFLTIGTFTPKKSGKYKLSSGIAQDVDTHCLYIKIGSTYYWARADGTTIPMDAGTTYTVTLKIAANYINNETYYPMIRREEISDSTFQAYCPTNRELYEMIRALQGGA
jgi:hypothetical protein